MPTHIDVLLDIAAEMPDNDAQSLMECAEYIETLHKNIEGLESTIRLATRANKEQAEQIKTKDLAIMVVKDWLKSTVVPTKSQLAAINTLDKALKGESS